MSSFARGLEGSPLTLVFDEALSASAGWLSAAERDRAAAFPVEKRRREWTLGRLAAKAAVARALGDVDPRAVVIDAGPEGEPRASRDGAPLALGLSVTHGHGQAAAWALADGLPGVDLERIRPRPEGTFRFYLDEGERGPLLALEGAARDAAAVVLWSIKEAAWKTLRPGRGVGLIDFALAPFDLTAAAGRCRVTFRGPSEPLARARGAASIAAEFRVVGDLVYAWARAVSGS